MHERSSDGLRKVINFHQRTISFLDLRHFISNKSFMAISSFKLYLHVELFRANRLNDIVTALQITDRLKETNSLQS